MQKNFSEALHYVIAGSVILCFLMFYLAEHGRANSFATYLVALCIPFALLLSENRRALMAVPRGVLIFAIALLEYLAVSAWWSDSGNMAAVLKFQGYALLIMMFLIGLVLSVNRYPHFLGYLAILTLAAAAVSAVYSIYLHFTLPEYQPLPEPRLYGLGRLSNPVISAASYGFAAVLGVWLMLVNTTKSHRILVGLAMVVLCVALVLSGTRTVWLALAVASGAGVVLGMRSLGSEKTGMLVFAAMVAAVSVMGLAAMGWEDVIRRGLSFRPEIWSEFVARSQAAGPLLGAGSGADSYWQTDVLTFKHPHSVFVSTFFFGGIVGLGLLLALIGLSVRTLMQADTSSIRSLSVLVLSYGLVFGFFDGDNILTKIDYLWWLIWFPIGLSLCTGVQRSS